MADKIKFWPIRGREEKILAQPYFDGKVYFAYDTNKIYLDYAGQRHPMGGGGSSGILYSETTDETLTKEVPEDDADDKYFMSFDALEAASREKKLLKDDLILNADGRFFRILSVDTANQQLYCQLLAVSGTGGSGGGGGVPTYSNRSKIYKEDPESQYLINGRESYIKIYGVSGRDTEDGSQLDTKLTVYWTLSEKGSTGLFTQYSQGNFPIDASTAEDPIWETFEFGTKARQSATNKLTMWVQGSASTQSRSFEYEFYTSELRLEKHPNFSNINTYTPGSVTIYCTTVGDLDKKIFYYFETEEGNEVLLNQGGTDIGPGTAEQNYTVPSNLATHGAHKVRIELYQCVNGKVDFTASTAPIEMEIAVVEVGNEMPIIWLGDYQDSYYQYDNIRIPFRVYDPAAVIGTEITLYKDTNKIGNRTITDNTVFSTWEIVDFDLGMRNYYSITCGKDEYETRREISFLVEEDPARINMKISTAGLRYQFDASGRSNSESATNRATCVYGEGATAIAAKLEGFNWYNNGWVTDASTGNTCLRISNGATFSIPLKLTKFASTFAAEQSHTFEFQFKVRNVQDYSNIVHNVTRYQGNTDDRYTTYPGWIDDETYAAFTQKTYLEWSGGKEYDNYDAFLQWYLPAHLEHNPDSTWPPSYDDIEYRKTDKILNTNYAAGRYYDGQHGICIGAQDALFTNGTDTVNVAYVEDKLINLTIVYSHGTGDNGGSNKLMSIYLNGMLTGVARSTLTGAWNIGNDDSINIVFNSQYCDFDLYKIRIYNQPLTLPTVLTNYMVDLKDPVGYDLTQLAVVNNTIGESQLNFNDMVRYNEEHPDGYIMPYLVFTTNPDKGNVLPYSKQVKITDGVQIEFVNTGLERAYATGELGELAERAGQTVEEYYAHHCPSWIGDHITMQVQGTSSEFYPRRNYKAKTKSSDGNINMYMNRGPFTQKYVSEDSAEKEETHLKFFYYDNDTVGTTKFTLKIDYMESSGTYNMGFANMVKNAYLHHPLYDYYRAGAIQEASSEYSEATTYSEGKTYWYKNHKGNWKNTDEDELKINEYENPAGAFAMGPVAFAELIGTTKVQTSPSAEGYNKWYEVVTIFSDATMPDYLDDYRTSVQGFPVLAFHQTTDANGKSTGIRYIGRYNMLLDKGSDEAYGFKPIDDIYQKFIQKKGKPTAIKKIAECWEAENNSRGFCSFRDASTNRTDDKFFDIGTLTTAGAPVVADYWEYRYHDKSDSLDILYELNSNTSNEESIAAIQNDLGVDIQDSTVIECPDPKYVGVYTQGMKNAGDALLNIYSNWERAVRWVWSTDVDSVPSAGSYQEQDIGLEVYAPNTYYISSSEGVYELDARAEYSDSETYYKVVGSDYSPIKLCASAGLVYAPNTYYVKTSLGDYVLDPTGEFDPSEVYYELSGDEALSGAVQLPEPVTYSGHTYAYDTKEYRTAKFVNELSKHFNLEYLVTYFVMTEVFECYDSRGKNAMFASWGPQAAGGDYIWYPCFYDIDTQLGINNTGIPSFEYYVDATDDGCYSTNDSVLWNNLYRNFRGLIIQKYRQLRGVNSTYAPLTHAPLTTIERIESWYLADPNITNSMSMRGERPLIALNLDEYYKYITITNPLMGYQDRNGGTGYDNGTYFYALQGDRSLSRQQFLTNRLNYIDSWLNQGNYERGGTNIIRGRVAANSPSNTSDKWIEGETKNTEPTLLTNVPYWTDSTETEKTHLFDGEYWITMEPVRNSYVTVGTDTANFPSLKYTNLEGPVKFITPDLENGVRRSGGYHEQLYYIYGLDQMKSLGDMSRLYWTEFNIEGSATKMTDLLLGYDGKDEEGNFYRNDNINMYGIHASNSASDQGGMPLLKRINLSYIKFNDDAPTYNFSSCEKLEDFRAIGSNITNVTFADGVALKTLYLPETIKRLDLTEATKLNQIVTTYRPRIDGQGQDVYEGLYIPGLTDKDPLEASSQIETINLIGDCLGYDSYRLLNRYYYARRASSMSYITMTEVKWTPYKLIDEGTAYDPAQAANYFIDDGHFGFKAYTHVSYDEWNLLIKNGELYQLDPNLDAATITSDELLVWLRDASNFHSASGSNVPILSGTMYINNAEAINERYIEQELVAAYPEMKFFFRNVEKVPAAKYVVLNDDGTYDTLIRRSLGTNETFFPNPLTLISSKELDRYETRLKYDFYGWSQEALSPAAVENLNDLEWYAESKNHLIVTTNNDESAALTSSQWYDKWNSLSIQEGVYDYTFYAVFGVHKYIMTFMQGDNETPFEIVRVEADEYVTPIASSPYKDDSDLPLERTYRFTGTWKLENGKVLTNNNIKSNRNYTFYPEFNEQSVYDEPTNVDYFRFTAYSYSDDSPVYPATSALSEYVNPSFNVTNGVQIGIKPGITLSGKITLPTYSPDGKPVISFDKSWNAPNNSNAALLTGCVGGHNITHIFWYRTDGREPMLREIPNNAFCSGPSNGIPAMKLQYFEFPASLRVINTNAFYYASSMTNLDFRNATNLFWIGNNAFRKAVKTYDDGSLPALGDITFSYTVASIGGNAFGNLDASIGTVTFGDNIHGSHLYALSGIRYVTDTSSSVAQAFGGSGSVSSIYFYASSTAQSNAFKELVENSSKQALRLFQGTVEGGRHFIMALDATS